MGRKSEVCKCKCILDFEDLVLVKKDVDYFINDFYIEYMLKRK